MAQHDYNLANQSGADFRADLNNALSAIVTVNSGATAPSTTFSHQLWVDTSSNVLKIRNAANDAWVTTGLSITADNTFDINGGTINGITALSFSTGASVTNILDEDNLGSDSATALATQQSIKAYVDSQVGSVDTLAEILLNGNTTGGTDIAFGDNDKATFGNSDLEIYHNGAGSYIDDSGDGSLYIRANNLYLQKYTGETYLAGVADSSVYLYYNGLEKLRTLTGGIDVTGTVTSDGLTVDGDATISDGNPTLSLVDTTATNQGAEFKHNAGTTTIQSSNTSTHGLIKFNSNNGTDTVTRMQIDRFGDISFYDDTGSTQGLFWDASAESLGIGTTSPNETLSVRGNIGLLAYDSINWRLGESSTVRASISTVRSGNAHRITFGTSATTGTATEKMRLDEFGNLGIGTVSPSQKLHVQNGSSGFTGSYNSRTAAIIEGSASNGTALSIMSPSTGVSVIYFGDESQEYSGQVSYDHSVNSMRFVVSGGEKARFDYLGNFGIGTSSPNAKLDVEGGSMRLTSTDDANQSIELYSSNGNRQLAMYGYLTSYTALQADNTDTFIIRNSKQDGDITFRVNDGGTTVDAMRIDGATSNVGIGTTNPLVKTHIATSVSSGSLLDSLLISQNTASSTSGQGTRILLSSLNASNRAAGIAAIAGSSSNHDLVFYTNGNFATPTEKMRIESNSGNVGIGTDSPVSLLTVGSVSATNNYSVVRENAVITGTDVTVSATQAGMLDILSTSLAGSGKSASLTFSQNTSQFVAGYDKVLGAIDVELTSTGNLSADSAMKFYTSSGSTSSTLSEAMRIDSSQRVGIGTTSPTSILEVRGDGGNNKQLRLSTGATTYWDLGRSSANGNFEITEDSGDTYFTIDKTSGNVGIGTDSPDKALVVEGDSAEIVINDTDTTDTPILRFRESGTTAAIIKTDSQNLIFTSGGGTEKARIDSSGNLLVGKTSTDTANVGIELRNDGLLAVTRDTATVAIMNRNTNGTIIDFRKSDTSVGSVSTAGGTTSYNTTSDARLKDVTGEARGLEVITKLNPVAYNWKADGKADEGLIAQEVKEIVPNAVSGSEDEHYQMDYSKLVTPLVKAVQELEQQVTKLKSEIAKLKGE